MSEPPEQGAPSGSVEDEFGAAVPAEAGSEAPADAEAAPEGPAEDEFGTAAPGESEPRHGPPAEPSDSDWALAHGLRLAEALIFASDKPVTPARLQAALPEGLMAETVLTALTAASAGRGVELVEVGGGYAFRTAPDLAPALTRVIEVPRRLPRAAMEALAIIAYHQPVTRGEIEEIRGASLSQTTLEALLEASLVAPKGKKEAPGRPTLWGTTPQFLAQFGLKALTDLPRREELVSAEAATPLFAAPAPPAEETPEGEPPQGEPPQGEPPQGEPPQGEPPQGEPPAQDEPAPPRNGEGEPPA